MRTWRATREMIAHPKKWRLFPMHRPKSQASHHDANRTPSPRGASRFPSSTSGRDLLPGSSARSRSSAAAALSIPTWSRPFGEHPANAEVRLTSEAEYREEEWGEAWTPPHQPPPHPRYPKLPSCWGEQRLCCNYFRGGRKICQQFSLGIVSILQCAFVLWKVLMKQSFLYFYK